jgi:hypothetical protein
VRGAGGKEVPITAAEALDSLQLSVVLNLNQTRAKSAELLSHSTTYFVCGEIGEWFLKELVTLPETRHERGGRGGKRVRGRRN